MTAKKQDIKSVQSIYCQNHNATERKREKYRKKPKWNAQS